MARRARAADEMRSVAAEVERVVRRVAPRLRRVRKAGAPTYRGNADVLTIGVWTRFVAVGFWRGAELARGHPLLRGAGRRTRVARLTTVLEARSRAFASLVRAADRRDRGEAARLKAPRGGGAPAARRRRGTSPRRRRPPRGASPS
jgi:hypothetical protein